MKEPTQVEMTSEKFEQYERVRQSGVVNMWDAETVVRLSAGILTEDDVVDIISNYSEYSEIYDGK